MKHPTRRNSRVLKSAAVGLALATSAFSAAQSTSGSIASPDADSTIKMNAFGVSTQKDYGYRKMSSVTSSRSGEEISKMPQAIEVISGELLQDFLANNGNNAFRYSSSVPL